jgi:PilZ domain-containing protein
MGKRREPRKPVQVTVRILGTDAAGRPFAEKVETLDVSRSGLHLCGLSVALKLEDTVSVSYKDQKARYHVKWLAPVPMVPGSPTRWNAGLENPAPERNIFDFPLPTPILDNYAGQSSSGLPGGSAADRRALPRTRCVASAELHPDGKGAPIMAGIADLSLGGCFVDMPTTLPIGTQLKVIVWLDAVKFQASAVVSNTRPGFGMGLHFTGVPPAEKTKLEAYLAKIPRYPFQNPR